MGTSAGQDEPQVGHVTLRYWASVKSLTGVAEEVVDVVGPVPLAELTAGVVARHGAGNRLEPLLATCSVLVGDRQVGNLDPAQVLVGAGESVEFLPPFAGG